MASADQAPPNAFFSFFEWCQEHLRQRGWGCLDEAAARYLRNWGLIQRDTGDAIKRLLDAVPQTRITKARLIEAAAKGDDAGEQEWVLPSGVDLEVFLLTRCAPFWMTSGSTGELFS
ncbi:hypothetical protein PC129_g12155 [Phytophthora cactorum]|uniref:Uncharacterized protein n=1 Tax=Phytophthora cactorum TaxID=29920 RepID=A0A8T0YS41_9STRA|nr:hypothetical protein Pcac1_g20341 [Phytophthora cactorum]KAG2853503.1 hypothetical protein PC113_g14111 [Phytophthora cactorum]KAG2896328.1 hypothetical protein PC114_g15142 [Phytophthora cactorum]KAG2909451.1 hypothetical protein PC115_g13238 [Phytophthora cactorum]KAG2922140.1 hypothetical protein PC117_g16047 [Phytophthora cactorum]